MLFSRSLKLKWTVERWQSLYVLSVAAVSSNKVVKIIDFITNPLISLRIREPTFRVMLWHEIYVNACAYVGYLSTYWSVTYLRGLLLTEQVFCRIYRSQIVESMLIRMVSVVGDAFPSVGTPNVWDQVFPKLSDMNYQRRLTLLRVSRWIFCVPENETLETFVSSFIDFLSTDAQ